MNKTLDTNFKGSVMTSLSFVLYKNQLNRKSFYYQVCNEFYTMVPVVIYFPKNNYLVENFSRKLEAFLTAGLVEYWSSFHMDMKYLHFKWTQNGPKKLTFSHLSGTFQLLIAGLGISILVFVNELFWKRARKTKIFGKSVKWCQMKY